MATSTQNPWHVPTLDEFLFYCCPECNVKTKEQSQLFDHALETHESSHESLVSLSNNIKKEPPEEQSEPNFTFKCNECNFASEAFSDINYHLVEHSSRSKLSEDDHLDIEMSDEESKCEPDIEQWLDTTLTEGIKEETLTEDFKSKSTLKIHEHSI